MSDVSIKTLRSLTEPLSIQNLENCIPLSCHRRHVVLRVMGCVEHSKTLALTTNEIRNKTPMPAPAVIYSGAGFFCGAIWCSLAFVGSMKKPANTSPSNKNGGLHLERYRLCLTSGRPNTATSFPKQPVDSVLHRYDVLRQLLHRHT